MSKESSNNGVRMKNENEGIIHRRDRNQLIMKMKNEREKNNNDQNGEWANGGPMLWDYHNKC